MRFSSVVEKAGKPDIHLMLMDPTKDRILQKAIKTHRVMTVRQATSGNAADYGIVGFEKGVTGQVLVFPKPIKSFQGVRIVGVKYDLLEDAPVPNRPTKTAKPAPKSTIPRAEPEPRPVAPEKVVDFPQPDLEEEDDDVTDLKDGIRRSMRMLEQGKQVAAFNVLKGLLE